MPASLIPLSAGRGEVAASDECAVAKRIPKPERKAWADSMLH